MNQWFSIRGNMDSPVISSYRPDIVAWNHVDVVGPIGRVSGEIPSCYTWSGGTLPIVRDE